MDRTHFLASQGFNRATQTGPDTKPEIDAFYEAHGLEVFARAFRLRRSIRSLVTRFGNGAPHKRDLAPVTSYR